MLIFFSSLSLGFRFQAKMPFGSGGSFFTFMGCMKSAQQTLSNLIKKDLITGRSSCKTHLNTCGPIACACPVFDGPWQEYWWAGHVISPPPVHRDNPCVSWHDCRWITPCNALFLSAQVSIGTAGCVHPGYIWSHSISGSLPYSRGIPQRTG